MERIEVAVDLSVDDAHFLQGIAEGRHCTVADLIEVAVKTFIERRREKAVIENDFSTVG